MKGTVLLVTCLLLLALCSDRGNAMTEVVSPPFSIPIFFPSFSILPINQSTDGAEGANAQSLPLLSLRLHAQTALGAEGGRGDQMAQ